MHTHTHSELATAGGSGPLATIISKNVDKAIRLFSMKCDEMVATGKEALQISGPPNYAQLKNISVVNTLHLFQTIVNQVRYCEVYIHVLYGVHALLVLCNACIGFPWLLNKLLCCLSVVCLVAERK